MVARGTNKQHTKLISSDGYSFCKQKSTSKTVWWTCSVRNKKHRCKAIVKQHGDVFEPGNHDHDHGPLPDALMSTYVKREVKEEAAKKIFTSAAELADAAVKRHYERNTPTEALPRLRNLAKAANRWRQKRRPKEPKGLKFELDKDFIPEGFLKSDVKVGKKRHVVFATNEQYDVLSLSKNWYADGTFKVIKKPFKQLFSIHAFVKGEDGKTKQVPLCFAVMSRRKARDYKAVLRAVKKKLPDLNVKSVTLDFEKAMWIAFREVFPDIKIYGCMFHWSQAVYRKIQNIGLARDYRKKRDVRKYLKKLMSIPYLPAKHIPRAILF